MQELTTVELRPEAGEGAANTSNFSPPLVGTRPTRTQSATPLRHRLPAAASQLLRAGMRMLGEEADHGRLLLFSPVFLGTGSAVWFLAASDFPLIASLLCLLALTVAVVIASRSRTAVRATLLALALVACGMVSAQLESWRISTVILDSAVTTTVTGRVERREGDGRGRWRYILAVTGTEAPQVKRPPERITAIARGADAAFEIGDIITGRARLTPPAGPALPELNDFSFSAYFDGIGANGFFYGAPTKADLQAGPQAARSTPEALLEGLYRLRSGIGDRIRSILPGDTGAFAAALVTDERRAISDATTEALRQSGLAHIIAISGLNMALSAGIFFVGFRMLLSLFPGIAEAYPTKKIAAAGALIAVTAYFLISGFAVSAERAFIMMAIMLIAVFFDRPSISLRNVALSALVIIAISPSEVLGPSFQMSFAATLALVSGYQLWKDRRVRENAFLKLPIIRPFVTVAGFFGGVFLTSLIGGFSTALFSIEHFHRLTAYGLPANLATMPIISFIIMPAGLLAMLLMPFGLDVWAWKIVGFGLDLVIAVAKTVSGWGGNIDVGRLPAWYFAVAVAGFLLLTLFRTRLRHVGTSIITVATLILLLLPGPRPPDLVISEDGSLAAVVEAAAMASNRERPPDFIFDQWQRALVRPRHDPPKMLDGPAIPPEGQDRRVRLSRDQQNEARTAMRAAAAAGDADRFSCVKKAWCTSRLGNGQVVTVIDNAGYLGPACDAADIVVTSVRLRFNNCRSGATLFTGETLRRTGSIELRFTDTGLEVATAFDALSRPWMRHRAYDWRSNSFTESGLANVSDSGE
ncbi:ComEC family competence protein [Rhizobium laguerreae]|uniref:ComEC/Rec2-related protein n=1 Tax=Rhizobium laguerreae TaxID=1076926 RepID=A0AAX2QVA0_9HYPH|nr:ComEC/Rec2 family competence protein [Rhizobium laguerreae]MBY3083959.1 ComEC family competence protein [Rhizobium laguerreae]MBY3144290.1 ComEC family competence protein [Rhizobium laguerreae]MBY3260435.1 ComEC family competence protein [Rhizobium laguerreae]MBY3335743.1 ComEC family competence protein [Rhizobium laguerreae]TCU30165.1 ComEC/Rec2-related protein [Rhizobium laguerreae]